VGTPNGEENPSLSSQTYTEEANGYDNNGFVQESNLYHTLTPPDEKDKTLSAERLAQPVEEADQTPDGIYEEIQTDRASESAERPTDDDERAESAKRSTGDDEIATSAADELDPVNDDRENVAAEYGSVDGSVRTSEL